MCGVKRIHNPDCSRITSRNIKVWIRPATLERQKERHGSLRIKREQRVQRRVCRIMPPPSMISTKTTIVMHDGVDIIWRNDIRGERLELDEL
jgi:hypothetical protein